ncbi:MAG TPA: PilZ domain-containing protein [Terriglobales bacterium]|nr:PilZ domain-containing protein [Terriglobales bacterium]
MLCIQYPGESVAGRTTAKERRMWERLPLAIPVFVRGHDPQGKEFLEFATALNLSAGGALLVVSRAMPLSAGVSLEVPSAPLSDSAPLPHAVRRLKARVVHARSSNRHQLLGLKFSRPLLRSAERKVTS